MTILAKTTGLCNRCGADLEVWEEMGLGEHLHFQGEPDRSAELEANRLWMAERRRELSRETERGCQEVTNG